MNRKGAILKFVLIGIIALSVVLIGAVTYLYQTEIAKNTKLLAQVDEITAREKVTEGKLEASKKKVSELTLMLQEAKDRIATISEDLDKEKSARQDVSKELEQIKADIEQQKSSRQDIENKLTQAQNEGRKLKEQLKIIEQQRTDLIAKIKNLTSGASGVELGKVVVNNETTDPSKAEDSAAEKNVSAPVSETAKEQTLEADSTFKPLEGKVTVVNKEYSFAVINLGQKDGVNIGDQFSVYHEGKVVGDVKVEKIHESMSAAGFAAELKDIVKENDSVVQKAK
jgi:myosin heavy subunit